MDGVTRLAILAVCFGLGALGGFLFSALSGDSVELMDSLQQYFQSAGQGGGLEPSLAATVWDLVRWPLAAFLLGLVPLGAVGVPLLGGPKAPGPLLTSLILSLLMAAVWCAIFTVLIMNFSRKAASAVCCILLFLLIFGTALTVYQVLDAPEFYPSLQLVDGEMVSEMVRNPRYLQPDERKIYELLLDLDPVGQAVQFTDGTVTRPVQMALCSMGIFAVTTAAGLALFRRKDLK